MRWTTGSLAYLTLTASVMGCASTPPGTVVRVNEVESLSGTWVGTLIDARNMGTPARIVISSDATYSALFGDTSARGTIVLQPDGELAFTMTSAAGLLGTAESSSTATLYSRGGRRVLVGHGRVGLREYPFSWEVTEQK